MELLNALLTTLCHIDSRLETTLETGKNYLFYLLLFATAFYRSTKLYFERNFLPSKLVLTFEANLAEYYHKLNKIPLLEVNPVQNKGSGPTKKDDYTDRS